MCLKHAVRAAVELERCEEILEHLDNELDCAEAKLQRMEAAAQPELSEDGPAWHR